MSVACYLRVSTDKQDHDSQEKAINSYLQQQGITQVSWYKDTITGKTLTRDDLNRLCRDIDKGKVNTVVVFRLDRLSRSLKDGLSLLSRWTEQGVRVVSITQQIDLSGAVGRMLAAVLLGLAEIELETFRERVKAGVAVAKAEGKYKGRKKGTYKGSITRAKELRSKGLLISEIASTLGVSVATTHRYLSMS